MLLKNSGSHTMPEKSNKKTNFDTTYSTERVQTGENLRELFDMHVSYSFIVQQHFLVSPAFKGN